MFKTGMTGLIKTLGPLPMSLLKGAKAGTANDWTKPGDFVYATQPVLDAGWEAQHLFEDIGGLPTQVGERMYQEILLIGNVYRIAFSVTGRTAGTIVAEAGTTQGIVRDADGTYTDTLVCVGNTKLGFYETVDFDGTLTILSVENLSVAEALPRKTTGTWASSKFTQPAAANMPHYDGKALVFDGVNDFMPHSGPPEKFHTSQGFTAAFVIEPEITLATGLRTILDQTNGDVANAGIQAVYDAATQQLTVRVSNGSEWAAEGSTWLSRGIPHVVDVRWDPVGGLRLVVDDHSVDVAGGVESEAATSDLQLGRRVGGEYFGGRVSDLVVRAGTVPEKDIERWRGKMRGKWAEKESDLWEWFLCRTGDSMAFGFEMQLGYSYTIDWGDGVIEVYDGSGTYAGIEHSYTASGTYKIVVSTYSPDKFTGTFRCNVKTICRLPKIEKLIGVGNLYMHNSGVIGELPLLDITNTSLTSCPVVGRLSLGPHIRTINARLTLIEHITSLSGALDLRSVLVDGARIHTYEPSVIGPLCASFEIHNNLLPQSAVDQIIQDFHTNLSNRPKTGTLNVGGTGNAAPSAAAKLLAQEIREHGWTVTVVGGLD